MQMLNFNNSICLYAACEIVQFLKALNCSLASLLNLNTYSIFRTRYSVPEVDLLSFAKNIGKIAQFKKKRNITIIYNEKLHYNCLQQLPTLRFQIWILRNKGILVQRNEKPKLQPTTQSPC